MVMMKLRKHKTIIRTINRPLKLRLLVTLTHLHPILPLYRIHIHQEIRRYSLPIQQFNIDWRILNPLPYD